MLVYYEHNKTVRVTAVDDNIKVGDRLTFTIEHVVYDEKFANSGVVLGFDGKGRYIVLLDKPLLEVAPYNNWKAIVLDTVAFTTNVIVSKQ